MGHTKILNIGVIKRERSRTKAENKRAEKR
jgi:hypothetical protein